LPGYVGYYVREVPDGAAGDEPTPLRGALLRGLAAFAGVLTVIAILTAAVVVLGRSMRPLLDVLEPAVGVALIALGVAFLLEWRPGWHLQLPKRRTSLLGFGLFGAGYAIAAAGCVAPLFVAIVFAP
jgi:cytochrome c-type biogenesis protein